MIISNSLRRLTETDLSLAKTPPVFDFHVPQESTKKSILYNRGQTPIPSLLIFDVLSIRRFSGASMARGRTGSRELFLSSDGFDATSPAQARRPERIGRPISAFAHPLCP